MPLTPDEVANKKFTVVLGRGYDRSEVDQFLSSVAEDYSAAIQKIAVAASGGIGTEDDIATEMGELLRAARETAERVKDKARREADRITAEIDSSVRQELEQAEKRRAELLDEAEDKAVYMVAEAEERAREITKSSLHQRSEFVARMQERYGELVEHEMELRGRTEALERLVTKMKARLGPLEQIDLTDYGEFLPEGRQTAKSSVVPVVWEESGAGIRDLGKSAPE